MSFRRSLLTPIFCSAFISGVLTLTGCGGGNAKETSPVTGTVTLNDKPVSGGTVTFIPKAEGTADVGKPASSEVGSDGKYTLSTYGEGDGAVVGKHEVRYDPPSGDLSESSNSEGGHAEAASTPTYTVEPKEVAVKAEANTIDLKLVPEGK